MGAIAVAIEITSDRTGAGHVVGIAGGALLVTTTLVAFAISSPGGSATSAGRSRST